MSAPTKCEKCGAKGTYAIRMPCVMGCGGEMFYDHDAANTRASVVPPAGERRALDKAFDLILKAIADRANSSLGNQRYKTDYECAKEAVEALREKWGTR